MDIFVQTFEISTLRYVPEILAWGIGLVLAIIIVGRGGAKAEKLFLAGCSLMVFESLAAPFLSAFMRWLISEDISIRMSASTVGWLSLPLGILGLAGLVCLIIAFWSRFKVNRQEPVS